MPGDRVDSEAYELDHLRRRCQLIGGQAEAEGGEEGLGFVVELRAGGAGSGYQEVINVCARINFVTVEAANYRIGDPGEYAGGSCGSEG